MPSKAKVHIKAWDGERAGVVVTLCGIQVAERKTTEADAAESEKARLCRNCAGAAGMRR